MIFAHNMHKYGVNIRVLPNGRLALPRRMPKIEALMDQDFKRVDKLEWEPTFENEYVRDLTKLVELIGKTETAYLVGKGVSLDAAMKEMDYDLPVIAINDAAWAVQQERPDRTVICVCQDCYDGMRIPEAVSTEGKPGYILACMPIIHRFNKHPNIWGFTPSDFGLAKRYVTVGYALSFAKFLGVKELYMIGFDAVKGDFRYSKKAGHERNFKFGLKESHAGVIKDLSKGLKLTYYWPQEVKPDQPAKLVDDSSEDQHAPRVD